jgi:hypothetical protein
MTARLDRTAQMPMFRRDSVGTSAIRVSQSRASANPFFINQGEQVTPEITGNREI